MFFDRAVNERPSSARPRTAGRTLAAGALVGGLALPAGAASFAFDLSDAPGFADNPAARDALTRAGTLVGGYFANYDASIELAVTDLNDPDAGTLATGGTTFSGGSQPGFGARGFVGSEILDGRDRNGGRPDGRLTVNFGSNFGFVDPLAPGQFDFVGTLAHEILHTVGFSSSIDENGRDLFGTPAGEPGRFAPFDRFVGDVDGPVIDPGTAVLDAGRYSAAATGGAGDAGLFFHGPEAIAANGGAPVPLFSPEDFSDGSSISHLDDDTLAGDFILNAATFPGEGPRGLSAIEQAILRDIGFTELVDVDAERNGAADTEPPAPPAAADAEPATESEVPGDPEAEPTLIEGDDAPEAVEIIDTPAPDTAPSPAPAADPDNDTPDADTPGADAADAPSETPENVDITETPAAEEPAAPDATDGETDTPPAPTDNGPEAAEETQAPEAPEAPEGPENVAPESEPEPVDPIAPVAPVAPEVPLTPAPVLPAPTVADAAPTVADGAGGGAAAAVPTPAALALGLTLLPLVTRRRRG